MNYSIHKDDLQYLSIRKRVLFALRCKKRPRTAAALSRATTTNLDSLSATLSKMVNGGELIKTTNFGPRGGNGYSKAKRK